MRRQFALLCTCWLAYCGAPRTNTLPLQYGMTPQQAEAALGEPLIYHSGRGGSKIFIAVGPAGIPGFYRTEEAIALQFRDNRLTGWKRDYRLFDQPRL
jgi:hypothetical protein